MMMHRSTTVYNEITITWNQDKEAESLLIFCDEEEGESEELASTIIKDGCHTFLPRAEEAVI